MMLIVNIPDSCENEARYILRVLFAEFWGIEYAVKKHSEQIISIETQGARIETPATFFSLAEKSWLKSESLPLQPLEWWETTELRMPINLINSLVPVIYGISSCDIKRKHIRLGLDIFGSAFFMLSRYEEAVKQERDNHDRFPARASLAYQESFLDRPVVNEYIEILWACMKHLWPGLTRKKREFRVLVSADVDVPYSCGAKNYKRLIRQTGGDIIKRRNPMLAMRNMLNYTRVKRGDYSADPFLGNFEWMMDVNEAAGNRIAFYFIVDHTDLTMDGCYSIHEPLIRTLIRRIHEHGHEIGLHASYNSFCDKIQICKEADILHKVMKEEGINQEEIGGRQHFLRWETPTTAQYLELARMTYDTTLSFAEYAGFRCGVCYEYPFYDVIRRKVLNLRERPLIIMEKSVFDPAYMDKSAGEEGRTVFENLKARCRQFAGNCSILWHNNEFTNKYYKEIYQEVIQ